MDPTSGALKPEQGDCGRGFFPCPRRGPARSTSMLHQFASGRDCACSAVPDVVVSNGVASVGLLLNSCLVTDEDSERSAGSFLGECSELDDLWWVDNAIGFAKSLQQEGALDLTVQQQALWCAESSRCTDDTIAVYGEQAPWPGAATYSKSRSRGVGAVELRLMLRGSISETAPLFDMFLAAEGQLVRCIMRCEQHRVRLALLSLWVVLVYRFCGPNSLVYVSDSLQAVMYHTDERACAPSPVGGMLTSFASYLGARKELDGLWMRAMMDMAMVRKTSYSHWAFDRPSCFAHLQPCL